MRRFIATVLLTLGLVVAGTSVAAANPGPGNSNQCAPGQHDGTGSNDRPASCDNK
jgi:hypothetical protein